MQHTMGWWWPAGETHILQWMANPKNKHPLNGRDTYQGKKQSAVLRACRSFDTAIDIGAHVGLWSYNLAHAFKHVHAFEPVNLHRLCFERNVPMAKVTLHACALGAAEGTCSIDTVPNSSGDSKVAAGTDIPMHTLDSFKIPCVDLIKIDCEGYEENVLIGAVETIQQWKPTIIVEAKRDMASRFGLQPQGAVRWLEKQGYVVREEIGGDFIMTPKT